MATLDLRPHRFGVKEGRTVFLGANPYVRLSMEGESPIFIQGGKYFGAGGPELKKTEVPKWVDTETKKLSPLALREAGLVKPDDD